MYQTIQDKTDVKTNERLLIIFYAFLFPPVSAENIDTIMIFSCFNNYHIIINWNYYNALLVKKMSFTHALIKMHILHVILNQKSVQTYFGKICLFSNNLKKKHLLSNALSVKL